MTTRQTPDAVREAIVASITKADADFGYSYRLTKMDDTGEEHTLFMNGFEPTVFQDRGDGYPVIEQRRNAARTDAILAALDSRAGDAVPADVLPETIGRVRLGDRRADGWRLCSHGHPVPAGHPLYWPEQISQYDDSDPLCLTHAIDQLESDSADWGEDYEAVDAVPAGEVAFKAGWDAGNSYAMCVARDATDDVTIRDQDWQAFAALSHGEGRK